MKKIIPILLALAVAYSAHAVSMITGSFNIYGVPEDSKFAKERIALAVSLIGYHDFDILATQNNFHWQTKEILKLGKYKNVGVDEEGKQPTNDNTPTNNIFYKADKYTLLDNGSFWLSDTPNQKSNAWESKNPLNCNWAKFKDNASGKEFFVFNTRFNNSQNVRVLASKLLVKKVKEIARKSKFIVAGSLYIKERESATINALAPRFMIDTRTIANKISGPKGTFTNLNYNEPINDSLNYMDPRMKFDYIFVSKGTKVKKCGHLTDNIMNAYPSKHLPVEAYIEF